MGNKRRKLSLTKSLATNGSHTFLTFQLRGPQRFFSITYGALFSSINFHAKSSEEQERSSRPHMFNQAQLNGMIYQKSATFLRSS